MTHASVQRGETDGDATSVRGNGKRGRPRKGSDKDNKPTHFYLENADGVPFSEEQITEMSRKARMIWRSLDSDSMAPQTFGQISMRAWEYYSSTMLVDEAFEFLLFCDDGEWKLREWSTRSYPSWYRNRLIKDVDDELEKDKSFLYSLLSTMFIRTMSRLNPQLSPSQQRWGNRRTSHGEQQHRRQCHGHKQWHGREQ